MAAGHQALMLAPSGRTQHFRRMPSDWRRAGPIRRRRPDVRDKRYLASTSLCIAY